MIRCFHFICLASLLMLLPACSGKCKDNLPTKEMASKGVLKADANVQSTSSPTLLIEDQVRAENLLRIAQLHIEQSRKIRADNPKEGIAAARGVLAKYPNTEYAHKARELLRRVPDRWKTRHNITDEELGL